MTRHIFALAAAVALTGCLPQDPPLIETEDTDPPQVDTDPPEDTDPPKEEPKSGVLSGDQITVTWAWVDEWDGGSCMQIEIQNHEEDAFNWEVTLGLDAKLESLLFAKGAKVTPFGNRVIIEGNNNEALTSQEVTLELCTEPQLRVERITSETMPGEPTEVPEIYGTILDQDSRMGLRFTQSGRSNGGDCLLLEMKNLDPFDTIERWEAVVHFRESFHMTDSNGMFPIPVADTQIRLLPEADSVELEPFASATGMVCMVDIQAPELLRTEYELLPEDTDAP